MLPLVLTACDCHEHRDWTLRPVPYTMQRDILMLYQTTAAASLSLCSASRSHHLQRLQQQPRCCVLAVLFTGVSIGLAERRCVPIGSRSAIVMVVHHAV
eukprot:7594-Heterococcus_DN1.PRE.3